MERLRESKAEEGCVWSRYAIIIQRRIIKLFNSAKKDVIRRHRAAVSNIIVGFLQIDFLVVILKVASVMTIIRIIKAKR